LRLCQIDQLPDGAARGFDPLRCGHDTMLIVRRGSALYAWRDSCPHQPGTRLPWHRHAYLNAAGDRIVCSAHGALFEVDTGLCTLGPCVGQCLQSVPVIVTCDGGVELEQTP
jgi:nitrite reductase/ring-hydroxylating ferredoxin subunit